MRKLKLKIIALIAALRAIANGVPAYAREYSYFARNILRRSSKEKPEVQNKALTIRKRAHHLERFLFDPEAYPPEMGAGLAAELHALIDEPDTALDRRQVGWARKILTEYEEMKSCEPGCPLLVNGVEKSTAEITPKALLRLMRRRRSRRVFVDTPLTHEERMAITEAAQSAPSSCNRQTIELIFVEDAELKKLVSDSTIGAYQFFHKAPCIIVFVSDARDYRFPEDRSVPFIDGATAVENIYLLCEAMGLGCCWGSYASFGSVVNEPLVRRKLSIPDSHIIVASIAVGRSTQKVCDIPRDPPENRFGINRFRNLAA